MGNDAGALTDPSCLDIYSPIQQTVYRDSNWNDVRGQVLNDAGPVGGGLAEELLGRLGVTEADQWAFHDVATTNNTLTATQTPDGGSGYTCQRAMGLRNNVIIDMLWCGFDTTNQAGQVVDKIGAAASRT